MKKYLMFLFFLFGSIAMARIPDGSICISPNRLSVAKGTLVWVYLDRTDNSAGTEIWKSSYSSSFEGGFMDGIVAMARSTNRQIILDAIKLKAVGTSLIKQESQQQMTNALRLDVDRECE